MAKLSTSTVTGGTMMLILCSWNPLLGSVSPIRIHPQISTQLETEEQAMDSYNFLVNWFERFPQYKYREFYITGESYAGHYVPQLSQIVYSNNKGIQNPLINFKGFMVSNAVTNDYTDFIGTFEYWWTNGLISDDSYHELMASCKGRSLLILSKKYMKILDEVFNEMGDIDPYSIFSPTCNVSKSSQRREHRLGCRFPWFYRAYDPCLKNYATMYYNLPEVQIALHANITGLNYTWSLCRLLNWTDSPKSVVPIYKELIAACLKIWVFSGDADAIVPITGTRYSINALNLTTLIKWYPWYDQGTLGGWSQVYKGLTFVTVHGAGHEVPLHRPRQALILFRHFLKNKPMPSK